LSYSEDLRKRAVLFYENGPETRTEISKRFDISLASLSRWIKCYRVTGTFKRKPRSGGRKATITADRQKILLDLLSSHPDLTLAELATEAKQAFNVPVSIDMVFRALRAAMVTQKKTLIASERETPRVQRLREEYLQTVKSIALKDFVFLDECGVSIQMTRRYGRAIRGKRVHGSVPANWGRTTTILGALTLEGILAVMHIESPTDKDVFIAFLREVLMPACVAEAILLRRRLELSPGKVIVLDNLSPHKVSEVLEIITKANCQLLYLPPYSPDLNPIEQVTIFSSLSV
jgi:transposase